MTNDFIEFIHKLYKIYGSSFNWHITVEKDDAGKTVEKLTLTSQRYWKEQSDED